MMRQHRTQPIESERQHRCADDRGSVMLQLSVVVGVVTIFVTAAVLAVTGAQNEVAAIGCQANQHQLEIVSFSSSDLQASAQANDGDGADLIVDQNRTSDFTDLDAGGVVATEEIPPC